ncbi:hypothetical protein LCGC14_0805720 [marine sediment metagenome]|uniref:Uncharacterized protein n=1 Tax=marine sediment metagenome TaxID=412755 RepID=A0A0F9SVI1_9ZZZZ
MCDQLEDAALEIECLDIERADVYIIQDRGTTTMCFNKGELEEKLAKIAVKGHIDCSVGCYKWKSNYRIFRSPDVLAEKV